MWSPLERALRVDSTAFPTSVPARAGLVKTDRVGGHCLVSALGAQAGRGLVQPFTTQLQQEGCEDAVRVTWSLT